ncbi:DUF6879 family protein [Amycolatopsis sp. NPDC051061]|uniref:DUF6879 family protein n=1 Tax=Amycolatopsis sp. NPDC051061 TaxID=3155042 RepID=UPI00341D1B89
MQHAEEEHDGVDELPSPTEYLDLMSFKRTSFRLQLLQAYDIRSEREALERFKAEGACDVPAGDSRLVRQRQQLSGGRVLQRVQVVTPPVSGYLRFAFAYFRRFTEAGEDIRIIDTALAATDGLPGHDFVLLDDEVIIKLHHAPGSGRLIGREALANADVARFRAHRDHALAASIPFIEYEARVQG